MENKDGVFQNIDYENKTISEPLPDKMTDIDTDNTIYNNIIDNQINNTLDLSTINSFTGISRARNQVYELLDLMGEDPIISSALEIYASDACEPNEEGKVMWTESEDPKIAQAVNAILDSFNIDKNAYAHIYALCKYGDLYGRLYRESEFFPEVKKENKKSLNESKEKEDLDENLILKIYSKNDRYAEYMEAVKNPAEMFDLVRFGKTCGFIRTHIPEQVVSKDLLGNTSVHNQFVYNFKENDIDIYGATEFVHACLEDNSDRVEEEVSLSTDDDNIVSTFAVRRGQSILYNSFKIWRELSLLENSVMLNRLTKSSIIRTVNIEVGDMGKNEVQTLLHRIKSLIEQKSAYNVGLSIKDYTSPGPIENVLYFPTHEGKGAVSTDQIGGDVNVGELTDLDYWKNKLYGSLGIPKQYLGDTDDATGFNGGTSLSLISSRYAKLIRRIQNTYIQMLTDACNLILLDRGLLEYIGRYNLKMVVPATQEERDRKENLSNSINNVREIMGLLDPIENSVRRLEILKSLLSNVISNTDVIGYIQEEIDDMEASAEEEVTDTTDSGESTEFNFDIDTGSSGGGFEAPDLGGGAEEEELPDLGEIESEPMGGEETTPEESFYNNKGGDLLIENDLPSWNDLGVSYNNAI